MLPGLLALVGFCGYSVRGSPNRNRKSKTCLILIIQEDGGSIWSIKIIIVILEDYWDKYLFTVKLGRNIVNLGLKEENNAL